MKKKGSRLLTAGIILFSVLFAMTVLGIWKTPYDPGAMSGAEKWQAPSLTHWMGTDNFGRDIFSRVLKGIGNTFFIAVATVGIGGLIGTAVGAVTGYFGGVLDEIFMRVNDVLTAFPSILTALVLIGIFGGEKQYNVIFALVLVFVPGFARMSRTAFASQRGADYVCSARILGASHSRIILLHILPNILSTIVPTTVIAFNNAVLAEASMSYLGIGVKPPAISLGYMLSEAQSMLTAAPWYALNCGLIIVLLIFSVGLIGEGLKERR